MKNRSWPYTLLVSAFLAISCGSESSGPPTVTLEPTILTGDASITGTVTLPDTASSGRYIQLQIDGAGGGSEIDGQTRTTAAKTVTYSITGLAAGTYSIRLRVDQTGNQAFGDAGDFEGYCCGTTAAPITDSSESLEVTVSATEAKTAVDFGVGTLE